jgi:hypothetical protein
MGFSLHPERDDTDGFQWTSGERDDAGGGILSIRW